MMQCTFVFKGTQYLGVDENRSRSECKKKTNFLYIQNFSNENKECIYKRTGLPVHL